MGRYGARQFVWPQAVEVFSVNRALPPTFQPSVSRNDRTGVGDLHLLVADNDEHFLTDQLPGHAVVIRIHLDT